MQTINDRKSLASWAVFKQLCDEGHKNIYEVLRDFVKATLYRNSIRYFTEASLTEQVNKDYEFNLKTAVVAQAIKELSFNKDSKTGLFECDPSLFSEEEDLDAKIEESTEINNEIINGLFDYAAKEKGETLTDSEKESMVHSLVYYLLNNSYEDSNSTIISAYILRCRQDQRLSMAMINILEGVVRYVGVNFDTPEKASSHWNNEMTIYLDTEILFHMAGYNGTLYKQLFDDFYELVAEINEDSLIQRQRKIIALKYFDYVTEEIDKFFDRANDIINGKIALNPSVTAMKEITLGCKTESELAEKKGLFLALIHEHGIEPDNNDTNFYQTSQYAYNIEDESIVEKYCKENNYKRRILVQNSLLSLSHVNVLRQGVSNRAFEKLGFVLLTDNYVTQKVAWMEDIKKNNEKPLCTNLYFLTNRMWYRLGKSFGNNATPKVFDVISKAQIILSNKINDSVYAQYEKLVERMEHNEISHEGALEVLYQLRSQVKNPEEIDSMEEVDEAMRSVSEPELQKYMEDAEYRKSRLKQTEEENERLNRLNEQVSAKNEEVVRQNKSVCLENESIRQENETIRQENERVKKESTHANAQLENIARKYEVLEKELQEARKNQYETQLKLYKRNMEDFVSERKKKTSWLFVSYILFLIISCVLSYLTIKYDKWPMIPNWVKPVVLVVISQIFPIIRSQIAKINFKVMLRVIFKKDLSSFEEEFVKSNPKPILVNSSEKN